MAPKLRLQHAASYLLSVTQPQKIATDELGVPRHDHEASSTYKDHSMKVNSVAFRIVSFVIVAALANLATATADSLLSVPDFTKGAKIPKNAKHDWNLGPTGLRGWIFCDKMVTTDARQILITKVDKGSPADGAFQIDDVILGVSGKPFSDDPRTELGQAITAAESKVGSGKLTLTRWRASKSEKVILQLATLGSYSATAPYDCPKSQRLLEEGCKALAARITKPAYVEQDPIPRSLNALALLASGNSDYLPLVEKEAQWAAGFSTNRSVIPELTKIANYFEKEEPNFPKKLMQQKAKSVRETIRAIEASKETPELRRLETTERKE